MGHSPRVYTSLTRSQLNFHVFWEAGRDSLQAKEVWRFKDHQPKRLQCIFASQNLKIARRWAVNGHRLSHSYRPSTGWWSDICISVGPFFSFWKGLKSVKDIFFLGIKMDVTNEWGSSFWIDKWCSSVPPGLRFLKIFALTLDLAGPVSSHWSDTGWNIMLQDMDQEEHSFIWENSFTFSQITYCMSGGPRTALLGNETLNWSSLLGTPISGWTTEGWGAHLLRSIGMLSLRSFWKLGWF